MEERLLQKEQVIDLYKSLEQFLRSEDFDEDIKKVLQKSHPKYLEALEKRINDMQRSDHAIVIAGETGAGKSTLINKILGKRIFKEDNLESTSTICKIRNSEKITLIVEHKSGKTETRDLTDKCDMETKEGIQTLRNILNDLTNMTGSTKGNGYKNVDIGFPIPFLQDGVILLDTPGIGGSREVSDKLMEYLLNAVLFVFVINVGGAGGMQKDRLPKILRSLVHLGIENEMPCFDPRDVLFVTNKWDTIASFDSDSEEEDHQKEQTWRNLRSKIERQWPHVKKEHIFKMSLKEVNVH